MELHIPYHNEKGNLGEQNFLFIPFQSQNCLLFAIQYFNYPNFTQKDCNRHKVSIKRIFVLLSAYHALVILQSWSF